MVRDRVRHRLPLGALGRLVAGARVRRDLREIFDYRRRRMGELFPARGGLVEAARGTEP
jgi:hypothetical protein